MWPLTKMIQGVLAHYLWGGSFTYPKMSPKGLGEKKFGEILAWSILRKKFSHQAWQDHYFPILWHYFYDFPTLFSKAFVIYFAPKLVKYYYYVLLSTVQNNDILFIFVVYFETSGKNSMKFHRISLSMATVKGQR